MKHARADEGQASDQQLREQARQLFNEGLDFVEHENWAEAEDRFRRVLALRSSQVVSYNLASALTHLGRLVESSELLRAIARDAAVEPTTRDAATQLLSEIEPRIGTLTIRVNGDSSGASFSLDDKPIELSGHVHTLSIDPGEHRVSVQRDGAPLAERSAAIGGDSPMQAELSFELPPRVQPRAVAAAAAPPRAANAAPEAAIPTRDNAAENSDSLLSRPWFWIAAGAVVAAGVVTAIALGASAHTSAPVQGDTQPPLLHGRVRMAMP